MGAHDSSQLSENRLAEALAQSCNRQLDSCSDTDWSLQHTVLKEASMHLPTDTMEITHRGKEPPCAATAATAWLDCSTGQVLKLIPALTSNP